MKLIYLYLFSFGILISSCKRGDTTDRNTEVSEETVSDQVAWDTTMITRFRPPEGYIRTSEREQSFQSYLRNLKLKPKGSMVHYYNGGIKYNHGIYDAVVDLDIGDKDLHQCADAVMRLRAEYLWSQGLYEKIHFNFTNGHRVEYKEWMAGKRMNVKGNKSWWTPQAIPSNTSQDLWNYLEEVFMYAGTASLEKELVSIPIKDARIGDVLIQGGYPGHAVIIVDQAINKSTGKHIYILAQSYMPAQELQILKNPQNTDFSPWYAFGTGTITTPEWEFQDVDIKRFND